MKISLRPAKFFGSLKYIGLFVFTIIALGQFFILHVKNQRIEELIAENSSLKNKIGDVGSNIERLQESQNDIRLFQREIMEALKVIDNLTAIKFVNKLTTTTKKPEEKPQYTLVLEPQVTLAQLDLTTDKSRIDNSVLLAKVLNVKNLVSAIPSMIPTWGGISSNFGTRKDPFTGLNKRHDGVDIAGMLGAPIYAPAEGLVIQAGYHRDFGKRVEIKHPSGLVSRFAHLKDIMVFKGQKLERGQVIGSLGNTGKRCHGAHLHYEVEKNGVKIDPKHFMLATPPSKDDRNI